ncbi:MAG: nucleotidyl transferase AbiEii/AbiGii toxin family protein [Chloroflexia bacterium]|nr:nucleotidyl transferase AbiEii/AbiGii toxin family protein [Chloroflexia bacterium]
MSNPYPRTFQDIAAWSLGTATPIQDARTRFAQFVILCGIASEPSLRNNLVFKGGNALDFVLQPNRSTIDLDFSLDMTTGADLANAESLLAAISTGLSRAAPIYGCGLAIHSIHQNPRGSVKTFITFEARLGYALPDERKLLIRMANNQTSPHVMPVEISINEPIFDSTVFSIDERFGELRISTLEDIVGEKLRALLQQSIRNRNHRQDVLDLAVAIRTNPALDRDHIASALLVKALARGVPVSRGAFKSEELARRARLDYDALEATTRTLFIPFDEALAIVLTFVDELPIPET